MRLFEIDKFLLEDDQNPVEIAKDGILDAITPLRSQGVDSITLQQLTDMLSNNPDLANIDINQDFVEQAISGIQDVELQTNSAGVLCLMLTSDPGTQPKNKAENQNKVDDAATRTALASLK